MEEDDEDKLLLSSLGITSANPEDIERRVLSKAITDAQRDSEYDKVSNDQELKEKSENNSSSHSKIDLYNKLRALQVEIDAVASTVDKGKAVATNDDDRSDDAEENEKLKNGITLQQALAKDRLKSLKQTRAQLLGEISNNTEMRKEALLSKLVEETSNKRKSKLKAVDNSKKDAKSRRKTVSYSEDADFDAVLDAASAGFVETERDQLVRKGILTPFHKLKGFERSIQEPESSSRHNDVDEGTSEHLASSSISRAAQSMSNFAKARPTTKLLDPLELPALEPPTRSFHRLKASTKRKYKKTKRPLPNKKYRKEKFDTDADGNAIKDSRTSDLEEESEEEETNDTDDEESPVILEGGLKIPKTIYSRLFDYQKVGVQWLWELHCQRAGGIIGDEMGLGKTIQIIAFLGALHFSNLYKPSIIICPVTLLRQWQREARKWYPSFKVEILHDSAHGQQKTKKSSKSSDSDSDYESEASLDSDESYREKPKSSKPKSSKPKWSELLNRVVNSSSGLLLTTYEQLRLHGDKLLDIEWGYAILDEGHRIRNPNAEVTLVCKQLHTVHRIIMTGAPIQNKLAELWSLFDFVFPGKLGVLPVFESEFAVPITVGGYANATPLQVSTAYRCAVVLRDLIMPYLLRRMKADVNAQLPKKTEHVLFCSLSSEQRSIYRAFLASTEVEEIFDGSRNSLYGIDVMRKICNHPDLLEREYSAQNPDYGNLERSGKMKVVVEVLKVWKEQGHRVLLFTQTQQMLDILEKFMTSNEYSYRRMDGLTPVKQRMALIDEFNNSDDVFVFIMTTKVGGLGTNLVGANRVIIYDPDWNPSTDMQARERAWRIGQKRDVTIYRLITRGTIEEKVYHRQIYKHFLTNKILKNPQQRRFFKARDMRDLFTLKDDNEGGSTETSNIFSQLSEEINLGVGNNEQEIRGLTLDSISKEPDAGKHSSLASSSNGKEIEEQQNREVDDETDILKNLFDAQGIHSAVNHDAIMNASEEDKLRMEEQASHVARRAAEALRESRMLRSRESFAVPTWTGRSGAAGAPSSARRKFGSSVNKRLPEGQPGNFHAGASSGKALTSSELLARVRGTQERAVSDALEQDLGNGNERAGSRASSRVGVAQPEVLIRQLCSFMQQKGGESDSVSITLHFKDRVQSKDLPLFKNLLKEIACLERNGRGTRWVLKPDYR